ncbi:MAG: hypothetical protein RLP09_17605 [Sandaracinaceae bacterium]|nr:hypothetical protein [Myxococcales bacterium]
MNPAEWLALGGLIRLMLQADGKVTLRENAAVGDLAIRLGAELWTALVRAELELPSMERTREQARLVQRPEIRALIRDALEELARADGLEASERELLDWLDEIWAE